MVFPPAQPTSVGGLLLFYFPQTFAFKKMFCKLANRTLHRRCSGWAAAAEELFQSSEILGKSRGTPGVRGAATSPGGAQRCGVWDESEQLNSFTWTLFFAKYINQCSLRTTKTGSAIEADLNVGHLEVSAILNAHSVSSLHRSLCSITLQMMSSWCGTAFRNNLNVSITGLALPMHTSSFSFTVIGTRPIFWNLLFHWRKKLPPTILSRKTAERNTLLHNHRFYSRQFSSCSVLLNSWDCVLLKKNNCIKQSTDLQSAQGSKNPGCFSSFQKKLYATSKNPFGIRMRSCFKGLFSILPQLSG